MPCDTGDGPQARALIERTVSRHGRIDVLVNNAGIFTIADFLDVTEEDFDRVLRVNLKGYFLVGQAAAREMAAAGSGSIINMSSVNGVMAIDSIAPYVVSKGGVNQLTSVMALALAPKGVRVNAIGPGTILTEMSGSLITDKAAQPTGPLPHTDGPRRAAGGDRRHRGLPRERGFVLCHGAGDLC